MDVHYADRLSQAARQLLTLGEQRAYGQLVVSGGGDGPTRARLATLNAASVLTGPLASQDDASGLLAGLWLWHDFLDESHEISQGLHSATGSFWHAIMHRREGDFSNAKYWYARCRNHPALAEIASRTDGRWDPNAFVDLVERVHDRPDDPQHARAVELQRIEWECLFAHSLRAVGGPTGR